MPPPRPASGDTIYIIHASGSVTYLMSMLACQYSQPKRTGDLDLWPFDLESGVPVTCDVGYLCANCGLPRPLRSRLGPDVSNRQTDVRQTDRQTDRRQTASSLNTPPRGRGHNKLSGRPPQYAPAPCKLTFDLLTLKVVSESRVTWVTSVPILVFLDLSVLDLCQMYATDRLTSDRRQTRIIT